MKTLGLMTIALLLAAAVALTGAPAPSITAEGGDGTETASAAPSGLTATYAAGKLTLGWTKGTDSTYLKQFVEWRVSDATPADWWIAVVPTARESLVFPNRLLEPGATHIFRVSGARLVDGVMASVASSNQVTVAIPAETSTDDESPAAQPQSEPEPPATPAPAERPVKTRPSGLTAERGRFGDYVTLTWTPGTNPNYTSQVVMRRVAELTPIHWTRFEIGVSDSTYNDYSAEPGYPYIYRVRAEKANDKGGETKAAHIIGPGAPDNRSASNLWAGRLSFAGLVELFWDPAKHPLYRTQFVVYTETYRDENGVLHENTVRSYPFPAGGRYELFVVEPGRTYVYWVESHRSDNSAIRKEVKKISETVTHVEPSTAAQ